MPESVDLNAVPGTVHLTESFKRKEIIPSDVSSIAT